ncbi:MAG: hypothetical protein WAN43_10150 [Rhodomicrobium sp.]
MGNLPWIAGALVAGGILHILCVFGIPALAEHDAWSRLSASLKPNTLAIADGKTVAPLPYSSPDEITAYCLFDLSERNLLVRSPLPEGPWSLAISTRSGENFYVVTGADAKKSEARLLLIRRDRLSDEASTEKTEEGDDQNIVVSPSDAGVVAIRAPLRGESFRAQAMSELRKARCELQPMEPVVASAEPSAADAKTSESEQRTRLRRRRTR